MLNVEHSRERTLARCASAICAIVLIADVYRAATQSIVYDEAANYLNFVHDSLVAPLTDFNAANHVLFNVLAAITTRVLGTSEFSLRLPAVGGAVLYLGAVYAIARRLCGRGVLFVLTVAALAINPLVFDFQSAARGYGLALAWFSVGLAALLEMMDGAAVRGFPGRRPTAASVALGLAVCSNLAFLFPAAGLLASASVVAWRDRSFGVAIRKRLTQLWLPGTAVCAAVLAWPLRHARRDLFFFGADSLVQTLTSLVSLSLEHHPTFWTSTRLEDWMERGVPLVAIAIVVLVIGGGAVVAVRQPTTATLSDRERTTLLLGGSWAATLSLLVAAHYFVRLPYPLERTGLYFIPLFIVTIVAVSRWVPRPLGRHLATVTLAVAVLTSIDQFTVSSYTTWRFDAGSRDVAELIASWPANRPLKVATSQWLYQPALEFYRVVRFSRQLMPIVEGVDPAQLESFDFLVVNDEDEAGINRAWRRVYTHPISGARVLANPHLPGL